jgi:hypothetical protein
VAEQDNQHLSEANEVLKQDVGEVADCSPKVKKESDPKWELEKPKEEIRGASPAGGRCSCSAAPARKSSGSPPNAVLPPPKPAPVILTGSCLRSEVATSITFHIVYINCIFLS